MDELYASRGNTKETALSKPTRPHSTAVCYEGSQPTRVTMQAALNDASIRPVLHIPHVMVRHVDNESLICMTVTQAAEWFNDGDPS